MSENIVKKVLEKFQIESFLKINPNTEKEERPSSATGANARQFEQATVTAVLAGMYKYGSTDEGAKNLFRISNSHDLLNVFFAYRRDDVINGLAVYGNILPLQAEALIESVAIESVEAVKEIVGADAKPETVRSYIAGQRHNILVYLPPDLRFGKLIGDDILDDRTNKMEGPVSSVMHFIENLFAEKDTDKAGH